MGVSHDVTGKGSSGPRYGTTPTAVTESGGLSYVPLGQQGICQVQVEGVFDVMQRLRALPDMIQNQSMKKALQAGAQVVLNAAISKVPKKSGNTASAISVKTTGSGGKLVVAVVCEQSWPYVGVFLEKGTLNHYGIFGQRISGAKAKYNRRTRLFVSGNNEERMAPHKFMQPALEVAGETAVQVCIDSLKQDLATIGS